MVSELPEIDPNKICLSSDLAHSQPQRLRISHAHYDHLDEATVRQSKSAGLVTAMRGVSQRVNCGPSEFLSGRRCLVSIYAASIQKSGALQHGCFVHLCTGKCHLQMGPVGLPPQGSHGSHRVPACQAAPPAASHEAVAGAAGPWLRAHLVEGRSGD